MAVCREHYSMELVYFCEKCREASCPECFFGRHVEHGERKLLKDVLASAKESLFSGIDSLEKSLSALQAVRV